MNKVETIECACHNSEHMLLLHMFPSDNMISLEYHLVPFPFLQRVKLGIKYIFGYKSKYGCFDEIVITDQNYEGFKKIINFFESDKPENVDTSKTDIIKSAAKDRGEDIRYGQAVFNISYQLFPEQTDTLRGTNVDCYHNDDNVNDFLYKLHKLL